MYLFPGLEVDVEVASCRKYACGNSRSHRSSILIMSSESVISSGFDIRQSLDCPHFDIAPESTTKWPILKYGRSPGWGFKLWGLEIKIFGFAHSL